MITSKILLFIALAVGGSHAILDYKEEMKKYDEQKLTEMYNCMQYLVCKLGKN